MPASVVDVSIAQCSSASVIDGQRGSVFLQVRVPGPTALGPFAFVQTYATARNGSALWPSVPSDALASSEGTVVPAAPAALAGAAGGPALVYVTRGEALEARDATSGALLVELPLPSPCDIGSPLGPWLVTPASIVAAGVAVVTVGNCNSIVVKQPTTFALALSPDGKQVWNFTLPAPPPAAGMRLRRCSAASLGWGLALFVVTHVTYAVPEGGSTFEYAVGPVPTILALDAAGGETIWNATLTDQACTGDAQSCVDALGAIFAPVAPVMSDTSPRAYVVLPSLAVAAMDVTTGELEWLTPYTPTPTLPPVTAFDLALISDAAGDVLLVPWPDRMEALDGFTGAEAWPNAFFPPDGLVIAAAPAIDGKGTVFLALYNDGLAVSTVVALNGTREGRGRVVWSLAVVGRIVSAPVIGSCGALYVVLSSGHLVTLAASATTASGGGDAACVFSSAASPSPQPPSPSPQPPAVAAPLAPPSATIVGGVLGGIAVAALVAGVGILWARYPTAGSSTKARGGGIELPKGSVADRRGRGGFVTSSFHADTTRQLATSDATTAGASASQRGQASPADAAAALSPPTPHLDDEVVKFDATGLATSREGVVGGEALDEEVVKFEGAVASTFFINNPLRRGVGVSTPSLDAAARTAGAPQSPAHFAAFARDVDFPSPPTGLIAAPLSHLSDDPTAAATLQEWS